MEKSINKEVTNQVTLVGNIANKTINIDHEKGIAQYGIAVYQGKDKEPEWFSCMSFAKKDNSLLDTLAKIKEEGKGIQVFTKGFISHRQAEKETGEKAYYTNFNMYSIVPTKEFLPSTANLELKGEIFKPLEEHVKTTTKNNITETKTYATLVVSTVGGKDKEGKDIITYHSMITSNKDHIESLKQLSKGADISIKKALLNGKGNISLTKNSIIESKKSLHKENKPKEVALEK